MAKNDFSGIIVRLYISDISSKSHIVVPHFVFYISVLFSYVLLF